MEEVIFLVAPWKPAGVDLWGRLTRFFVAVTIDREHKTRTNHNRSIKVLQIRQIPGLVSQLGEYRLTCNWKGKITLFPVAVAV